MDALEFFGENWDWIAGVIGFLITLIASVVTAVKTKNWNKVKEAVETYVKEAEILNADGTVKKEIVLGKVGRICAKLHLRFDEKKISDLIENIVTLTKTVNAREKDKPKTSEVLPE